jgi:thioredoxin-dependent peroxiredoxin
MMIGWPFANLLAIGSMAPEFEAVTDTGEKVRSADLRGRSVVLIFYPGDDTPGCTRQLCDFRDNWAAAGARGVAIFGVNPAGMGKHAHFRGKFRLPFPLLVDSGRKIATRYRANGLIVRRTVYLIGPDGRIRFARRGMPSPGEVLAASEYQPGTSG